MAGSDELFEGGSPSTRGRGDGNGNSGGTTGGAIDPASLTGAVAGADDYTGEPNGPGDPYARNADGTVKRNKDGTPRRKRGRKAGGGSGARSSSSPHDLKASIDALTSMLAISHAALAAVTVTPELELNQDEAKLLATATVPVLDMVDFVPDPRFIAVFGLVGACAQVYGPRAMLIRMRLAAERDARMKRARTPDNPQPQPEQFVPFAAPGSGMAN